MKILIVLPLFFATAFNAKSQVKDTLQGGVVIHKDYRFNIAADKEAEMNTATLKTMARFKRGYRLMVLNTSDKNYAFRIRTQLLQKYPDQKLYMWFANPYIRLKFGNFHSKEDAEPYRRDISKMLGGATIYFIHEKVEIPPGLDFDPESMREQVIGLKPENVQE